MHGRKTVTTITHHTGFLFKKILCPLQIMTALEIESMFPIKRDMKRGMLPRKAMQETASPIKTHPTPHQRMDLCLSKSLPSQKRADPLTKAISEWESNNVFISSSNIVAPCLLCAEFFKSGLWCVF